MILSLIKDFSKRLYNEKDPAHDFAHVERMMVLCKKIAPPEADISLVIQAAHFHGVLHEETNIRNFLKSLGFEDSRIERVIQTVRNARSVAIPQTI